MMGYPNQRMGISPRGLIAQVAIQRWKSDPEVRERFADILALVDHLEQQFQQDHGNGQYIVLERQPEVAQ